MCAVSANLKEQSNCKDCKFCLTVVIAVKRDGCDSCCLGYSANLHILNYTNINTDCLTNQELRHEGVWGSGGIDQHFPDLGTNWTPEST
jgi:hypothetical protein